MGWFSKKLHSIRERLFGKGQQGKKLSGRDAKQQRGSAAQEKVLELPAKEPEAHRRRDPYFIQIGLDFGTSYSKCICRDIMTDKAWIYIPSKIPDNELPFLIPSTLVFQDDMISYPEEAGTLYPEKGLYNIKNALVSVANGNFEDSSLRPYLNAIGGSEHELLHEFVTGCAVYFLAGTIGDIRQKILERFSGLGEHPQDYMAINMAIPVESAQQPNVNKIFEQVLKEAWGLADRIAGHPVLHWKEFQSIRENRESDIYSDGACNIYPEVSANVQGFIRSRVSSPGIYLFSDTGGGTVDQSVFIFTRQDHQAHLNYLAGRVLPLGSSHIERLAAEESGHTDCFALETWKEKKERGEDVPELRNAQHKIYRDLELGSSGTLALAKKKLFVKNQMNDIRLIFCGGGHRNYPYKKAVMRPFSGPLFSRSISPRVIGLPTPVDIELKDHETHWMRRLYVAYGLSFEKSELAPFTYPNEMSNPKPEEVWQRYRKFTEAPTKEQC